MDQISDCNIDEIKELVDNLPSCVWVKKSSRPLGQGVRGSAYSICCERDGELECKYVIKVIKRGNKSLDSFERSIDKEVRLQQDFAALGTAPRLIKAFMCDHEGVIIMERVDTDIIKYVDQMIYDSNITTEEAIEDINRIQRDFLEMLRTTYEAGLIHDDLHGENLAIKLQNGRYNKGLFIDFGEGFYRTLDSNNAREEYLKKAESLSNLEHDMILTFNTLRTKIENKKMDTNIFSPGTPVKKFRSPPRIDKRKKREMSSPIKSTKKKLFSFDSDDDF
jgi:tRNA A-37 threonylcarbamoyl transferase component Bud32